jgi:hypothetical protein
VSDCISEEVKARVRQQAGNQCGYCRSLQKYVWGTLEIEHTILELQRSIAKSTSTRSLNNEAIAHLHLHLRTATQRFDRPIDS